MERSASEARVYVIDADDQFRNDTLSLLGSADRMAVGCASAESFSRNFDPSRPACVVIDLHLPGLDGPLLQNRLRDTREWFPVIFTTDCADMPGVTAAMRAGAWHVLQKPVDPAVLLETVGEALEMAVDYHQFAASRAEIASRMSLLSKRERQVLDLLIQGNSSRAIASQLGNSCWTVEKQRSSLMHKMRAKTLTELAVMYCLAPSVTAGPQIPGLFWWTYHRDRARRLSIDLLSPLPATAASEATLASA